MSACPDCGADITHARTTEGVNVPLEKWTAPSGSQRYRILEFGPPLLVELVTETANIDAYPDHRVDCPSHGNGLAA